MARHSAAWMYGLLALFGSLLLAEAAVANHVANLVHELRFQRIMENSDSLKKNASALMAVVQDNTGFIWVGGENGLARFDGLQFKRYEPSPEPGAPPSNIVRDLLIDRDGIMWIATDRGLARYVEHDDRFDVFRPVQDDPTTLPHNVITSLALDQDNRLIVGTGSGISIVSADRTRFINVPLTAGTETLTFVLDTFVDSKNRIWVGTRDYGLFLLDQEGAPVRHFAAAVGKAGALQSDMVKSIEEDQFGRIWAGTYGGGVSRLNEGGAQFHDLSGGSRRSRRGRQQHGLGSVPGQRRCPLAVDGPGGPGALRCGPRQLHPLPPQRHRPQYPGLQSGAGDLRGPGAQSVDHHFSGWHQLLRSQPQRDQ
ncbi:MAG: hypothetical protein NVV73_17140 [Cellvibrionaceae bacterium]|nr:hypothetical protein [Cellvibrionaceae bacterium]